MWLFDWLNNILPSCLKGGENGTIITKLNDKNNVNIAGNSTQDNTCAMATKRRQSAENAFGADNDKRTTIVSNQSNKINTVNVNIQDDINELNIGIISANNNEDSFKESSYDEEENSLLELIMQMNNKEWHNTNCNNDGNIQYALNNTSLNDTTNLKQ